MELKYLNETYEKASEELKAQPNFSKYIESIDQMLFMINNGKGYHAPNFEISSTNNEINITMEYSLFPDGQESHINNDNNNRFIGTYKIYLDENNNLIYEHNDGLFQLRHDKGITYPNQLESNFSYEREVSQNKTSTILERQIVTSPINGAQLNIINGTLVNEQFSAFYANNDKELKEQVSLRKPEIINNQIKLHSIYSNYFTAYSAVRNPQDLNKASISEYIKLPGNEGVIDTKKYFNEPVVNMEHPDNMRLDAPYASSNYTLEQIEKLKNIRNSVDSRKFDELMKKYAMNLESLDVSESNAMRR